MRGERTNGRRFGVLVGGALIAVALSASPAKGAATIGEAFIPIETCAGSVTYLQTGTAPAPAIQYAAPSPGVITQWTYGANASAPTTIRFKVARPAGLNTYTTIGQSAFVTALANQLNAFATRIPVQTGDIIGYHATGTYGCDSAAAGYTYSFLLGDANVGSTSVYNTFAGFRHSISARLEPDADNDGFGDESQDGCPTNATNQGDCASPETTITKQPKKKSKSKKAEFQFTSSEAGSTFRCSLDGAAFDPCASPRTYSVKKGRHTFTVFAKDAAGNLDETPATYSWTVNKKKKK